LSTLTKVLIILQVVVVLILCGLVVTYVATADNYKTMYDAERTKASQAGQKRAEAEEELQKAKAASDQEIASFRQDAAKLTERITSLTNEIASVKREREEMTLKVASMAAANEATSNSLKQQGELYKQTREQLDAAQAEVIKKDGQIREVSDSLAEKMGVLGAQAELIKRLTDEKTELQGKVDQVLRQSGKAVVPPTPAQGPSAAQPQKPVTPQSSPKGVITKVDLENELAEISIGSVEGVRAEMKLYVTRESQFVCNLVILEVEAQKAVGILDLVQQAPKVGDAVSADL
jgi:chromosome segregation ATPase